MFVSNEEWCLIFLYEQFSGKLIRIESKKAYMYIILNKHLKNVRC